MATGTLNNQNATLCINTAQEIQVGTYNGKPLYRKFFTKSMDGVTVNMPTPIGSLPDATHAYIDITNSYFQGENGNRLSPYLTPSDVEGWITYFRAAGKSVMIRSYFQDVSTGTFYVAALYTKT